MFKTIVITASAALVALTFAASAHAGGTRGSGGINGISSNGVKSNGWNNGWSNGWSNGLGVNGAAPGTSTFAIDGIELPATAR